MILTIDPIWLQRKRSYIHVHLLQKSWFWFTPFMHEKKNLSMNLFWCCCLFVVAVVTSVFQLLNLFLWNYLKVNVQNPFTNYTGDIRGCCCFLMLLIPVLKFYSCFQSLIHIFVIIQSHVKLSLVFFFFFLWGYFCW